MAPDLDHHGGEHLPPFPVPGGFLGQVHRGDGAGLDGAGRVEAEVALGGQLPVALEKGLFDFTGGHGLNVFLEHRQRLGDLIGEKVRAGGGDLGHLDKEGAEFAHHLGDDFRLLLEIFRIGGEELAYIAQRPDLAPEYHQVLADDPGIAQDLPHLPVIYPAQVLHLVDHLGDQRLVGGEEYTQYVQADLAQAAQLGFAHQFVEELPELLGDLGRDGHHTAGGNLVHQEAQQVLGALLVGQQVAAAHAVGEGPQLQGHGVLLQRQEQLVQRLVQFLFGDRAAAIDQLDQRQERAVYFRDAHSKVAGGAYQAAGLVFQRR